MPAASFKAECLAVLDCVAATGESVVVTKRGRPVAEVVPLKGGLSKTLRGSVTDSRGYPRDRSSATGTSNRDHRRYACLDLVDERSSATRQRSAARVGADQSSWRAGDLLRRSRGVGGSGPHLVSIDRRSHGGPNDALAVRGVELMAVSPAVAVRAVQLPETFPGDPADRLIVATALVEGAPVVTRDCRIRRAAVVETNSVAATSPPSCATPYFLA